MGENLPYQFINDAVQKVGRISRLAITNHLPVFFAIADIAITLHAHFGVLPASGFDAGGQI